MDIQSINDDIKTKQWVERIKVQGKWTSRQKMVQAEQHM